MHLSTVGGFLVGLGAVLGLLPRLLWPPRPESGVTLGSLTTRQERLRFAVETTGLASAATGSILLVIGDLARWWLELAVVASAGLLVWGLAAHKLRQLWLLRLRTAADDPHASPPVASAGRQRELASARARWSWCCRHAFSRTERWPPQILETGELNSAPLPTSPLISVHSFEGDRLERRHISELHVQDARLADLSIPAYVAEDVAAIRQQGFGVFLEGDLVVVRAPDGRTADVARSSVASNSVTTVAARQRFLRDCEAIGVQIRVGARGQPHAANGDEWRLPETPPT